MQLSLLCNCSCKASVGQAGRIIADAVLGCSQTMCMHGNFMALLLLCRCCLWRMSSMCGGCMASVTSPWTLSCSLTSGPLHSPSLPKSGQLVTLHTLLCNSVVVHDVLRFTLADTANVDEELQSHWYATIPHVCKLTAIMHCSNRLLAWPMLLVRSR